MVDSIVAMGSSCVEVVCPDRCLGFAMSDRRLSAIEDMILKEMEESCEVVDLLSSSLASFRCILLVRMCCLRIVSQHFVPFCALLQKLSFIYSFIKDSLLFSVTFKGAKICALSPAFDTCQFRAQPFETYFVCSSQPVEATDENSC